MTSVWRWGERLRIAAVDAPATGSRAAARPAPSFSTTRVSPWDTTRSPHKDHTSPTLPITGAAHAANAPAASPPSRPQPASSGKSVRVRRESHASSASAQKCGSSIMVWLPVQT